MQPPNKYNYPCLHFWRLVVLFFLSKRTRLCLAFDRPGHKLWCSDTTSALDCAGKEREGTKGDWTDQKVHFGDLRSCFSVTGLGQIAAGFCRIRNFRCIGIDLSPNQVNFIKRREKKHQRNIGGLRLDLNERPCLQINNEAYIEMGNLSYKSRAFPSLETPPKG